MIDSYVYVIIALLPLSAFTLVFQVNPYHALVIRGILGAVAALVYGVLGASDVALTEALVGTILAMILYIVAVRSSLVMRLGILAERERDKESYLAELIASVRKIINRYHLRLELVEYPNVEALEQALIAQEIHATCTKSELLESEKDSKPYKTTFRVRRLFEIMETELNLGTTTINYRSIPPSPPSKGGRREENYRVE